MEVKHTYTCTSVGSSGESVLLRDELGNLVTLQTQDILSNFEVDGRYSIVAEITVFGGLTSLVIKKVS